jgi:hypothetical protein
MQNLFELSPEEKERWLKDLADLMGVWEDWRLLASFRDHLLPLAPQVARNIQERLEANPHTQGTDSVERALEAIAQVYFSEPTLDAGYLEKRAQAGGAYLRAGFGPAQLLAGIYGLWVDEWTKTFAQLFSRGPWPPGPLQPGPGPGLPLQRLRSPGPVRLRGGQGATPAGGGASAEVPPGHRHQPGALRADGQGGRRSVARPKRRRR